MSLDEEQSKYGKLRIAAGLLAALGFLVPIGAFSLGGVLQVGEWPSAMAPFGFLRIVVAFVLLSAPLVWWVSNIIARTCRPIWEAVTLLSVLSGLVVAIGTVVVSNYPEMNLGGDWLTRHLVRIGWVVVLQLPFAVASRLLAHISGPSADSGKLRWLDLAIVVALVVVVPTTFTDFVVQRQLSIVQSANRNLQLRSALTVVQRLNLFGCTLPPFPAETAGLSRRAVALRQTRNNLVAEELRLRNQIEIVSNRIQSIEPNTDEQMVGIAPDHYSLGQFEQAKQLLVSSGLAESHQWGALVMGYASEQQQDYVVAAKHYQRAIELESASDSPRLSRISSAYERLANTLRAGGQASAAEAALKAGIERHPDLKDRLTLQLGEHYFQAGRTQDAVDVFTQLADRDDSIGERARSQLEALNATIGICFVRTK